MKIAQKKLKIAPVTTRCCFNYKINELINQPKNTLNSTVTHICWNISDIYEHSQRSISPIGLQKRPIHFDQIIPSFSLWFALKARAKWIWWKSFKFNTFRHNKLEKVSRTSNTDKKYSDSTWNIGVNMNRSIKNINKYGLTLVRPAMHRSPNLLA